MNINISFDPIRLLGNAVVALVGGFVGNFVAAIIMALITPALDGGSFYAFAGLVMLAFSMIIVKVVVALVIAGIAMATTSTPGAAAYRAFWVKAVVGFLFSLATGLAG